MKTKNVKRLFTRKECKDTVIPKRPGKAGVKRKLHFYWIEDCSGSMRENMNIVKDTMQGCLPDMRTANHNNPNADVYVRTVQFATTASFVDEATPVDQYVVKEMKAEGLTNIGELFELLNEELTVENLGKRGLKPVLVLLCDGVPTDEWEDKLELLKKNVWFQKSVRIAIAIGCDVDNEVLNEFTGNPETVLTAENSAMLVDMIKWASTLVDPSASQEPCKTWIGENEKVICLTENETETGEEAEVVSFEAIAPPDEDE